MTNTTLSVPDISCGHCKMSIEDAVGQLDGVTTVDVAIEAKTVDLAYDTSAVSIDSIIEAIEGQGYDVAR